MPNLIERFLRAMILYAGLLWIVTGSWGIPASWAVWHMLDCQDHLHGNELYFAVMLLLVYGSRPIVGVVCVSMFRKLAARQYQQIPGIAEMAEPKWHDTAVFATLLATCTGLYCLDYGFCSLPGCITPLTIIGTAIGDITGIVVLDIWYYHWETLLVPIISLGCAIVLLTQTCGIAARVTRMIDTTPLPAEELLPEEYLLSENELPEDESLAKGSTDEQSS
jgi:hypothetical protein